MAARGGTVAAVRAQRVLWPTAAVLLPLVPLQAYFAGEWGGLEGAHGLGKFFGILSFAYFAGTLVLAARIRLFDRLYGHDRVMVFHRLMALAAICCAAAHGILKSMSYGVGGLLSVQAFLGIAASSLFDTIAVVTVVFMTGDLLGHAGAFARLRTVAAKAWGFDYSRLKLFHNLTALAMALVTTHILMASSTAGDAARTVTVGVVGGLGLIAYVCHKLLRFLVRRHGALEITSVRALGPRITELRAALPRGRIACHRPGQFGYFRVLSDACGIEEHPFTISSPPGTASLSLTAKALGNYTTALQSVRPGDRLVFDGPYGRFTPDGHAARYLFVAGGIGITPFLSIVAEWDSRGFACPVSLVWSVRTRAELVDGGLFGRAATQHEAFTYVPVVTDESGGRRIDEQLLREHLGPSPGQTDTFVCGPESLRRAVVEALRGLGVPRRSIHFEAFST